MTSKAQLNDKSRAELKALQELPDDKVDTSDIPEVLDWTGACRGVFNRPVKQHVPRRQHAKCCEKRDDYETGSCRFQTGPRA